MVIKGTRRALLPAAVAAGLLAGPAQADKPWPTVDRDSIRIFGKPSASGHIRDASIAFRFDKRPSFVAVWIDGKRVRPRASGLRVLAGTARLGAPAEPGDLVSFRIRGCRSNGCSTTWGRFFIRER